jgi:hypothetical protein
MLRATFQLGRGLGPRRERALWASGVTDWSRLDGAALGALPPAAGRRLRAAVDEAERALAAGDVEALAARLPRAEHWRLFGRFADEALFLDIETAGASDHVSVIGLLDGRGPRVLLAERDLERFPEEVAGARLLVTYNGSAFDVPILRRAFRSWRPPAAHIDVCHLWRRLGARGGLKALEEACGFPRPPHLRGLAGHDAGWLWRLAEHGDLAALRRLVEYNLYDVINLPALLALAYNRLVERLAVPADPVRVCHRGDVLYDVTKTLLALDVFSAEGLNE